MSTRNATVGLIVWLALCFVTAFVGRQFTPGEWYAELAKPFWTPPNWVFGPVWTVLYTMMGVAAFLVWRAHGFGGAPVALGLFVLQLILNAAWSYLFFGRHAIGFALGELTLLGLVILATILVFWPKDKVAAGLLIPYLLWVGYAATLNWGIWRMNA